MILVVLVQICTWQTLIQESNSRNLPHNGRMEPRMDYDAVRTYWDGAASSAVAASYMAHEQGLPQACVDYRFEKERAVVDRWFQRLTGASAVLDIGCGAGAWSALFAQRYRRVVGIELSHNMIEAARTRLAGVSNAELIEGDVLHVPVEGPFDGAFLGGLLMYLNRDDAVLLLSRLSDLVPNGVIILRESTIRHGVEVKTGDYQVTYRSPMEYVEIAAGAGLKVTAIERNRGYASMEIAVELVNMIRRLPALRDRNPSLVGRPLWRALELSAPLSLGLVPRAIEAAGVEWPHLTNHFMLLEHA
jgi:SAM-dependent methyltransferase